MPIVNHNPTQPEGGTRSIRITPRNTTKFDLSITDTIIKKDDKDISNYKYAGQRGSTKNSYVLIFDQAEQTCTLEPLTSSYTFNLTSAPGETSSVKLSQKYPQLQSKTEDPSDMSNEDLDEDPDGEADADNPYDFRHYLTSAIRGPSLTPSPALRAINTGTNTPQLISSRPTGTSDVKPRKKAAAKAYDPLRANQRKPKAAPAVNKAKAKPTPTIKVDRRASTRPGDEDKKGPKPGKGNVKSDYYVHSSDDDEEPTTSQQIHSDIEEDEEKEEPGARGGGLEIDFGDDPPPKKKNKALDFKRAGPPISLHSAVNSPDSRVITPRHQKKKNDPQEIIDFGDSTEGYEEDDDSDVEDSTQQKHQQDDDADMHDADADADADADEDEHDDDIEPMTLGSPAHQQPPIAEDEDDFEAQMLEAMQGDDSEEESEAE
jgi:hypothetical protein